MKVRVYRRVDDVPLTESEFATFRGDWIHEKMSISGRHQQIQYTIDSASLVHNLSLKWAAFDAPRHYYDVKLAMTPTFLDFSSIPPFNC